MDGYVTGIFHNDGYLLVRPNYVLVDGYSYGVYHGSTLMMNCVAFVPTGSRLRLLKAATPEDDFHEVRRGDVVKPSG